MEEVRKAKKMKSWKVKYICCFVHNNIGLYLVSDNCNSTYCFLYLFTLTAYYNVISKGLLFALFSF